MSIPDGWQMPRSNGRLDYSLVLARRENGQPPTAHHTTSNSHAAPAEPPDETPTASPRRGAPLTLTERAAIIDGYTRRREESPTLSRTAIVNLMCEEGEVERPFKTVYQLVSQHEQALGQSQRRRTALQAAQPDMVQHYDEVRPNCRRQVDAFRVVATRFGCSIAYVEKVVQAALKARKA